MEWKLAVERFTIVFRLLAGRRGIESIGWSAVRMG